MLGVCCDNQTRESESPSVRSRSTQELLDLLSLGPVPAFRCGVVVLLPINHVNYSFNQTEARPGLVAPSYGMRKGTMWWNADNRCRVAIRLLSKPKYEYDLGPAAMVLRYTDTSVIYIMKADC